MPMDSKDKNTEKNKQFITSIEFAFTGIKTVFDEERNMRKHVLLGIVAIIENVVDMFTDFHFHPIGKKIKDMAAGAVLMTAFFALIVAAIIFIPKILAFF